MKKLLFVSLLGAMTFPALSAETVNISVIGTISAASCNPSASGGGIVDYGTIKPDNLNETGPTVLEVKTVAFTVQCDAPANVALRAYSNRGGTTTNAGAENSVGSAQASPELLALGLGQNLPYDLPNITKVMVAGLGKANETNTNIGGYMLNMPFPLIEIDGEEVQAKYWTNTLPSQNTSWGKNTALQDQGDSLFSQMAGYFSYSKDSELASPEPFKELTGTLLVQAYITDKSNLDLSSPVNLDGSSTIELYYF